MAALALAQLLSGGPSPAESQLQVASGHSGSSGGGSFQKILLWEAMAKDNYSPVLVLVAENGLDPWINQGCHDLLTGSWQGVNLPQYAQPDYDFRPRRGASAVLDFLCSEDQAKLGPFLNKVNGGIGAATGPWAEDTRQAGGITAAVLLTGNTKGRERLLKLAFAILQRGGAAARWRRTFR